MSLFSAFVVYLLIWWITLFGVLPFGIRGQAEEGEVIKGSEPGAPVESGMKRKIILTTLIATLIWVVICIIIIFKLVTWDQLGLHLPGSGGAES
jgi:predicted secreted protein